MKKVIIWVLIIAAVGTAAYFTMKYMEKKKTANGSKDIKPKPPVPPSPEQDIK